MDSFFLVSILALSLASSSALARPSIPKEGLAFIHQVHQAAIHKDYAALETLMAREFVWSFGGDEDAKQAIAAWRENPEALQVLAKITRSPCAMRPDNLIECPRNPGTDYRAGFKRTQGGWQMVYFVAGD